MVVIGLLLLNFLLLGSEQVFAGGFAIAEQSARGVGLANAITAGVEDPSAVYINPAALTEVPGNQLMGGTSYINTISSVKNGGRKSRNIHDDSFVPSLFANYHIPNSDFAVGIGGYAPFGLATSYKESSFTRFAAIRSELRTIYVTPAVAWSPLPFLSIGAGVSFVHSSAVLSRALFLGALDIGEGRLRITDTDDAFGYNVGVLIKPVEKIKIGITYRSRVDLDFDSANVKFSDAAITGGASTRVRGRGIHVPIPPVVNAGVQWQITPQWAVELDYNFTRWSEFQNLRVRFDSPLPALGGALPLSALLVPQNWRDTSSVRFGTSYKIDKSIELRGGMAFDESPTPSNTLSPTIPGANIFTLNGGIGYTWERLSVDLAYMAIFYKTRRVSNNVLEATNLTPFVAGVPIAPIPAPGVAGRDKYEIFQNFVSLNMRYRF
jgi:long-chain fatty acid transport protein